MKNEELTNWEWQIKTLCQQYEEADAQGSWVVQPLMQMIISWGQTKRYLKAILESEHSISERFHAELSWYYHDTADYVETVNAECIADGNGQGI
jgi:hypothetical protein